MATDRTSVASINMGVLFVARLIGLYVSVWSGRWPSSEPGTAPRSLGRVVVDLCTAPIRVSLPFHIARLMPHNLKATQYP